MRSRGRVLLLGRGARELGAVVVLEGDAGVVEVIPRTHSVSITTTFLHSSARRAPISIPMIWRLLRLPFEGWELLADVWVIHGSTMWVILQSTLRIVEQVLAMGLKLTVRHATSYFEN